MTIRTLSKQEIKELKLRCRIGYILPFFVFAIGAFLLLVLLLKMFYREVDDYGCMPVLVIISSFVLSVLISYRMNYKYYADIRNREKVQEVKIIQKKESKKDWEAGRGTLYIGQNMNDFTVYSVVVEDYRNSVDEGFYMNCQEGDEVLFNYGPTSRYMLGMELKTSW